MTPKEEAAIRKLLSRLADEDDDEDLDVFERVDRAIERIDELEARLDQLDQVGDFLSDVSEAKTTKEQKVAAIVTYAEQKQSGMAGTVVKPKEIAGTVGCSQRYAYDLIDLMVHGDTADGALPTSGYEWALDAADNTVVDKDEPERGVVIDFERLQDDPEALNKFINGSGSVGVAD